MATAAATNNVDRAIEIHDDPVPLQLVEHGAIRVRGKRIKLDLIVEQFENGYTPEALVAAYDTLELPEVYCIIGYYLRHRKKVAAYVARRRIEADALQAEIEARRPPISRSELLARRTAQERLNAAAGE